MDNNKFTEKFINDYFEFVENFTREPDFYNYFRQHHGVEIKYYSPVTNPNKLANFEAVNQKSAKVLEASKLFDEKFNQATPEEQNKTLGEFTHAMHQLWEETKGVGTAVNALSYYPVIVTIEGKENRFLDGSDAENFLRNHFDPVYKKELAKIKKAQRAGNSAEKI